MIMQYSLLFDILTLSNKLGGIVQNLVNVGFITLCVPAIIGAIWALVLMWRNSKTLFILNLFIPVFPAIYFYAKYWREEGVAKALYLQLPALFLITIVLIVA